MPKLGFCSGSTQSEHLAGQAPADTVGSGASLMGEMSRPEYPSGNGASFHTSSSGQSFRGDTARSQHNRPYEANQSTGSANLPLRTAARTFGDNANESQIRQFRGPYPAEGELASNLGADELVHTPTSSWDGSQPGSSRTGPRKAGLDYFGDINMSNYAPTEDHQGPISITYRR